MAFLGLAWVRVFVGLTQCGFVTIGAVVSWLRVCWQMVGCWFGCFCVLVDVLWEDDWFCGRLCHRFLGLDSGWGSEFGFCG